MVIVWGGEFFLILFVIYMFMCLNLFKYLSLIFILISGFGMVKCEIGDILVKVIFVVLEIKLVVLVMCIELSCENRKFEIGILLICIWINGWKLVSFIVVLFLLVWWCLD